MKGEVKLLIVIFASISLIFTAIIFTGVFSDEVEAQSQTNGPDISKAVPVNIQTEQHCINGECVARVYSEPTFYFDKESNEWKDITDVVNMEFVQGILNISYKDEYFIEFEPYVLYNDNEYDVATTKAFMNSNNITYDIDIVKYRSNYKFAFVFDNIPSVLHDNINGIGFEAVNYNGFDINDVYLGDTTINIKNVELDLRDVVSSNFNISFQSKTKFFIGNTSANIIDNRLFIDPTITTGNETGGQETTDHVYVESNNPTTNYGTSDKLGIRYSSCCGPIIDQSYIDLDLAAAGIPSGATYDNVTLYLVSADFFTANVQANFHNVTDTELVEAGVRELELNWNNQPCGTTWGSLNASCNSTSFGSITPNNDNNGKEYGLDVTSIANSVSGSTQKFMIMGTMAASQSNSNQAWGSKRHTNSSLRPWFYVEYTEPPVVDNTDVVAILGGGYYGDTTETDQQYMSFFGDSRVSTEYDRQKVVVPTNGTIKTLYAIKESGGADATFTLYKEGSSTGVACTIISTGDSCFDLVDNITVEQGDTISMGVNISNATPTGYFRFTLEMVN